MQEVYNGPEVEEPLNSIGSIHLSHAESNQLSQNNNAKAEVLSDQIDAKAQLQLDPLGTSVADQGLKTTNEEVKLLSKGVEGINAIYES